MKEPPRDHSLGMLDPTFRRKLEAVMDDLLGHGLKIVVVEGWRSQQRQQWLFAQGRTRPGPIVTKKNGTSRKSYHQSGKAADIIFVNPSGGRYWPPLKVGQKGHERYAPEWDLIRRSAVAHKLGWGGLWGWDAPHLEWRT